MIAPPERSPERDAALDALMAHIPAQGWTMAALRAGLADIAAAPEDAELLFPGGRLELIEAFTDLTDRRMEQDAAAAGLEAWRLPARVRAIVALRLDRLRPHRDAVRRAAGLLALPRHMALAVRCTARTVDAIWYAAGDRSADFSWYTKRAILTGVYGSTLLAWLRDDSEDDAETLAFLDRRLADVGRITKLRRRLKEKLTRCRPGRAGMVP
jgi:ubiquinone biosynthesis protein COQ9